ncbi:MAG: hypothetical protein JSW48_05060 [Betaproteobacteria bacterium]|nr:MAG: hypothetical protein JSW48_05060 [Betaproteobacteria bacterium]
MTALAATVTLGGSKSAWKAAISGFLVGTPDRTSGLDAVMGSVPLWHSKLV